MKKLLAPLVLALSAPLALASGGGTTISLVDTFSGGTNLGGWTYNAGDVIKPAGGNPGGWWNQPSADTFAPIITSTSPALAGDYRASNVSNLSFDAGLLSVDFGDGSGINMSVLLRDTKGTPLVDDDDYAYYVGPNIPKLGTGWNSFSFPIPSQDTSAVPAGWTGGWVGDCCSFRPGVDWNDVIQSVDQIEIWWIDPSFFGIFQNWNIGLDNIILTSSGTAAVRNGLGGNPLSFVSTSFPDLGTTWTSTVDVATPGHPISFLGVSATGPTSGAFLGGAVTGELLVLPPLMLLDVAAGSHGLPIPADAGLVGLCVSTQAGTISSTGTIHLANALDLQIGG
jgi:hypothetical protein